MPSIQAKSAPVIRNRCVPLIALFAIVSRRPTVAAVLKPLRLGFNLPVACGFAQPMLREVIIARRTGVRKRSLQPRFPASGEPENPLRKRVALPPAQQEHPSCSAPVSAAASAAPALNGQVSIPMVSIPIHWNVRRHGMDWYPMHWSPLHTNAFHPRPRRRPDTRRGKGTNESRGVVSLQLR